VKIVVLEAECTYRSRKSTIPRCCTAVCADLAKWEPKKLYTWI